MRAVLACSLTIALALSSLASAVGQDVAAPRRHVVQQGDSLWNISHRYGVTVEAIREANHLGESNAIRLNQVLVVPGPAGKSNGPETALITRTSGNVAVASAVTAPPIQKFSDAFESTEHGPDVEVAHQPAVEKPKAPVKPGKNAKNVAKSKAAEPALPTAGAASNADPTSAAPTVEKAPLTDTPAAAPAPAAKPVLVEKKGNAPAPVVVTGKTPPPAPKAPVAPPVIPKSDPVPAAPTSGLAGPVSGKRRLTAWQQRLIAEARTLSARDLRYSASWTPPGESTSWVMDCSNTSRYLYKRATGIDIGRTASDQYYYLHQKNYAWDVPSDGKGPDLAFLRKNLQVGDLLFWEYTYKPVRNPPVTHVMVFIGENEKGEWLMAGSSSSAQSENAHNKRGGPDVYVFNPNGPSGGYGTMLGLAFHKGRFSAIGRPMLGGLTAGNGGAKPQG